MTAKKKILDLTGLQYLVQKVRSAINDVDSPLSTHIADNDIHVTTADKTTWNTVTSKANDSDVVHKSGDETVSGDKTFTGKIYSNDYYYGSTAWGLDKDNNWNGNNLFYGSVILPSFGSPNYKNYGIATSSGYSRYDNYYKFLRTTAIYGTDNTPDTSKPSFLTFRPYYLQTEIMDNVVVCNNGAENYLAPITNNTTDLGTSNNKWKSFNGLNPSSLSLPNIGNRIDISSYITDLSNVGNEYTPSVNGWISIRSTNATKISIRDKVTNVGNTSISNTATYLTVTTPVVANRPVYITVVCTSLSHAYFIPCLGNV